MREYSTVSPKVWTGSTGKALRGDTEAQLLAMYLITSPHSTMTGVFYCPLIYMAHDTGLPMEGASKALQRLVEGGFVEYDEASETVFVINMARWQISEQLKPTDNRVKNIRDEVRKMPEGRIRERFLEVYRDRFCLSDEPVKESPSEAPPKPLRSQEQEQEQEKENPLVDSDEPTGKQPKAKSAKNDPPPEFETLWSEYPQREGPNPKRDALKAYRARMREGVSPDDLIAGVLRYKAWLMRKGKVGTEFVQRASTFLGPGENWKQSFEAGGGGLTRPPETDRDAWLRLAKRAGVENRIAGKTHDQVWDMICESLAQQEVA